MPIQEIKTLSNSRSVAIWHITEHYEALLKASTLSENELVFLKSFKSEVKRKEWLAGRLAIKGLIESIGIDYQGIKKTDYGKPLLIAQNGEISLSHSFPYVAVIYDSTDQVGIDLEQPTPKLRRIAKRFLSIQEQGFAGDSTTQLCICWCAKETLYKIYSLKGLIFKENLVLEPFKTAAKGIISGSIIVNNTEKKYNLQYIVNEHYVLTYNV